MSGVVALPKLITVVSTCIPSSFAAAATLPRIVVSVFEIGRVARRPDLRDPNGPEARERREVHLRLRLHEARRADGVLGRAQHEARAAGVRRRSDDECGRNGENQASSHT